MAISRVGHILRYSFSTRVLVLLTFVAGGLFSIRGESINSLLHLLYSSFHVTSLQSTFNTTSPGLKGQNTSLSNNDAISQIMASLYKKEYVPTSLSNDAWSLINRNQNFNSTISKKGWEIQPLDRPLESGNKWHWKYSFIGFSTEANLDLGAQKKLSKLHQTVEIYHDSNVTEWFNNTEKGIEQGFTVLTRPMGVKEGGLILFGKVETSLAVRNFSDQEVIFSSDKSDVLKYSKLKVFDHLGKQLPSTLQFKQGENGISTLNILVDDTGAQYPITIDPLADSPAWSYEPNIASNNFGSSVATAGDVNGDGYSDIIVSMPFFAQGGANNGKVFVFHGSATGPSLVPNFEYGHPVPLTNFGASVATAGDVNGDGYSDVIIGASGYSNGQSGEGAAFVFMGSASGLAAEFAWQVESDRASAVFGNSVAGAGDVNGDGFSDVIVGARFYSNSGTSEGRAYIYHGSASGLSTTPATILEKNIAQATFGDSVASAGDVNGDGFSDVIVGSSRFQLAHVNEGAAYIFLGSASGVSTSENWITRSNSAGAFYGFSVSSAGDVNGDGYADVLVGAHELTNGHAAEGRVYMFLGAASGPSTSPTWTKELNIAGARFGRSVSSAGDVNGDGYGDIIIGAHMYTNGQSDEGAAFVFEGGPSGLPADPSWQVESNQASSEFGKSVGLAGDVNGDGFSDVIIGIPSYDNGESNEGRAQVFYGESSTVTENPQWLTESNQASREMGYGTSGIGDVNGDGYEDVVVGLIGSSRIWVFYGAVSGPGTAPQWTFTGSGMGSAVGIEQTGAGDVNGDGYDDLIVGDRVFDSAGIVYVFYGSATGLATSPSWSIAGVSSSAASVGRSVASAGDVNCDGYADIMYGASGFTNGQAAEGAVFVHYGSPTGPSVTPSWQFEGNAVTAFLGTAVASAGDVNKDGCSDIIVGHPTHSNGQGNEGRFMVFHGSKNGLPSSPNREIELNIAGGRFGEVVQSAGDVNGDGFSDIIIGAPSLSVPENDEGFVFLFLGSASGIPSTASFAFASNQADAVLGTSLASGDINGDGFSDIIVGAPDFQDGRVYVFHGASNGPSSTPARILVNNNSNSRFGVSVSSADINGDGFSDVLVGSPEFMNGQAAEGAIYGYFGNNGGGLLVAPQQRKANGNLMAARGSAEGTSFGIGLVGRVSMGRTRARLVWESKPLSTSFNGSGLGYGNWTLLGLTGSNMTATISGNFSSTAYHWRARLQYFPSMEYSMWHSPGNNGVNEQDFRSSGFDNVGPTVIASTTGPNPTSGSFIPITVTFSEPVTGFSVAGIFVTNATKVNFSAVSSTVYTVQLVPTILNGTIIVDVLENSAFDGGLDGNSFATPLSIIYGTSDSDRDGILDINDPDDDNDGVSDVQEGIDGTNPFDSGSSVAKLPISWCSEWNGFLDLFNINEYVNLSNEPRTIDATIFNIEGVPQSTNFVPVLGGAQTDSLVHDMQGWTENSYGKICSQQTNGSAGDIDGRMVYYRPNDSGYDFAFAMPFQAGLKGSQFTTFNTFQPSLSPEDGSNLVTNWIQITNLSTTAQNGTLYYYSQEGSVLATDNIALEAGARRDFAGHQFGVNLVGIIEWRPNSASEEFLVRNTRYYYDNASVINSFDSAMQLEGVKGSGELLSVPLDTAGKTAVLEVANVTASDTSVVVRFYQQDGSEINSQTLQLPPYGSIHLIADSILNGNVGMATVKGATAASVLAVGMHYGRTASLGIEYVYGIIAKQSLGSLLKGSYNTFLSQGCDLLLVNSGDSVVNSTISMTRFDGTQVLVNRNLNTPAKGTSVYDICSNEVADNYGVVTINTPATNAVFPTIIRIGRENMYRFPTTLK